MQVKPKRPPRTISVAELELTNAAQRPLCAAGVTDLDRLAELTESELLALPKFGRKGLIEVKEALGLFGRSLSPVPLTELSKQLRDIAREWVKRSKNETARSPYERQSGYLKRAVYKLARELRGEIGPAAALQQLDQQRGRRGRGRSATCLEYALLGAVTGEAMSRVERHRYADELIHAAKHEVPDEYLVGFLLQIGPQRMWETV